jgi:hypothetical protein
MGEAMRAGLDRKSSAPSGSDSEGRENEPTGGAKGAAGPPGSKGTTSISQRQNAFANAT